MKIAVIVVLVVLIAGLIFVLRIGGPQGPTLDQVKDRKAPRITHLPPRKMLVVEAKGDPNVVGKKAFGSLLKTYFSLKGVPKGGSAFNALRARWPIAFDTPADQWIGFYAIPVPDSIMEIPRQNKTEGGLEVRLTTWEYGDVAEVLHVGPYDKEMPTIAALKTYVDKNGCEIVGLHEEEYLRGPGMLFAGDPKTYLTIIRYQVREKSAEADSAAGVH